MVTELTLKYDDGVLNLKSKREADKMNGQKSIF